jgi:hypothetical protein
MAIELSPSLRAPLDAIMPGRRMRRRWSHPAKVTRNKSLPEGPRPQQTDVRANHRRLFAQVRPSRHAGGEDYCQNGNASAAAKRMPHPKTAIATGS